MTICKDLIKKSCEVKVSHVFREQNKIANALAKIVVRRRCDWIEFLDPLGEVWDLVQDKDRSGRHHRGRDAYRQ